MVVSVLLEGDYTVVIPSRDGVRTIADVGGGIGCPSLVIECGGVNGVVGRESKQLIPVGNGVGDGDGDGSCSIIGNSIQLVGAVALNNLEHVTVVSTQLSGSSAVPRVNEIRSLNFVAVGPLHAGLQGVGVGYGAVSVSNALGQRLSSISYDDQVALSILSPLGQTGEQMCDGGSTVNSRVQSGVKGLRLGSETYRQRVGLACNIGVHEVLVAQRVGVEAVHGIIDHVQVGVVVQRNDTTGLHQHILCKVHHCIAIVGVGAALDGRDQNVIGFSPSAVLDLDVITVSGQVKVVHLQLSVCALAVLYVVVTGTGGPHIQEADRIVVVSNPTVSCDRVVTVLTGLQESSPFLVFEIHGQTCSCQRALQILTDCLMTFAGIVQVGQSRSSYRLGLAAGCEAAAEHNQNENQCENSLHLHISFQK